MAIALTSNQADFITRLLQPPHKGRLHGCLITSDELTELRDHKFIWGSSNGFCLTFTGHRMVKLHNPEYVWVESR